MNNVESSISLRNDEKIDGEAVGVKVMKLISEKTPGDCLTSSLSDRSATYDC